MKRKQVRAAEAARKAARMYPGEQAPELQTDSARQDQSFDAHEAATRELLQKRVFQQTDSTQARAAVDIHDKFVKGLLTCELGLDEEEQVQVSDHLSSPGALVLLKCVLPPLNRQYCPCCTGCLGIRTDAEECLSRPDSGTTHFQCGGFERLW